MPAADFTHLPPRAIVVHGGMHKTGSSAIQNTLAAQRTDLTTQGWLYPQAGCVIQEATGHRHRTLMKELRQNDEVKGKPSWSRLRAEIHDWPGRVLISHENFFSPQIDPQMLLEELPGRDVYLLAYLRHPVDYVESCYREWVRRWKFSGSPREYYLKRQAYLELPAQAAAWTAAIGAERLLLRPYHRAHFKGGSVLTDFLSQLGLDEHLAQLPASGNDSLNSAQVMVHLVANQLRATPKKRDILANTLANAEAAARQLQEAQASNAEGIQPGKLDALRRVLRTAAAPGRIMDDALMREIEARHLDTFLAVLSEHGADAHAVADSSYGALPQDSGFFEAELRASVEHLLT